MTIKVTLEYRRVDGTMLSSGRIMSEENGLITQESLPFEAIEFSEMLKRLAAVLTIWPPEQEVDIFLQRTDREGLSPFKLDAKTVEMFRTDPVAAVQSFDHPSSSPSAVVAHAREERAPSTQQPVIVAGHNSLADAFGDVVYFKVRGHELECPGCGFWGMYTSPGLLADPERAGEVFKTIFVCPKKCHARLAVTCQGGWGYIDVEYLLEKTTLDRFYFPRAWNEGRPWVSRDSLKKQYDAYVAEKETVHV
jgi:hypothetical protein